MKSPVISRTIYIDGRKTGVSLEDAFWSLLEEIAQTEGATLSKMVTEIDKTQGNLSSAIRLSGLDRVRSQKSGGHRGEMAAPISAASFGDGGC
jgi:predicted DNA-binding ribbon-helix-helix protein